MTVVILELKYPQVSSPDSWPLYSSKKLLTVNDLATK